MIIIIIYAQTHTRAENENGEAVDYIDQDMMTKTTKMGIVV